MIDWPLWGVHLAESLKEQAYEAIKHRIIICAFKPGQELSQDPVAGLFKIGKTPVHQAFKRLNTEFFNVQVARNL